MVIASPSAPAGRRHDQRKHVVLRAGTCAAQACGHVWTVSKDGNETVTDVTERTTPAEGTPLAKPDDPVR